MSSFYLFICDLLCLSLDVNQIINSSDEEVIKPLVKILKIHHIFDIINFSIKEVYPNPVLKPSESSFHHIQ